MPDQIIEELHKVRSGLFKKSGGTFADYFKHLQTLQAELAGSGYRIHEGATGQDNPAKPRKQPKNRRARSSKVLSGD